MTDETRATAENAGDLKQACLDLSNAAMALFDQLDEHGIEAPFIGENALTLLRLEASSDIIREFYLAMAARRLLAFGLRDQPRPSQNEKSRR